MKLIHVLAFLIFTTFSGITSAFDEVQLQYARLYQSDLSGSCDVCVLFTGVIEVKNIAFEKDVTVHYETGFSGGWAMIPAFYIGASREGFEYWGFDSSELGGAATFAIEYRVGGEVFWDNNGNADYFIQQESPLIVNADINVLMTRDQRFEAREFPEFVGVLGSIHLRNLGFEKTVRVHFTTDGWQSSGFTAAGFNGTASNGLERWVFGLAMPKDVESLEFAVSYEVNGQIYWDNNLGRNYSVSLP